MLRGSGGEGPDHTLCQEGQSEVQDEQTSEESK